MHGLHRILKLCRDASPDSQCLAKVNDLSSGRLNRREVRVVLSAIDQELISKSVEYPDLKKNFEEKFKDGNLYYSELALKLTFN